MENTISQHYNHLDKLKKDIELTGNEQSTWKGLQKQRLDKLDSISLETDNQSKINKDQLTNQAQDILDLTIKFNEYKCQVNLIDTKLTELQDCQKQINNDNKNVDSDHESEFTLLGGPSPIEHKHNPSTVEDNQIKENVSNTTQKIIDYEPIIKP